MNQQNRSAYYKSQILANLLINSGLNGVIAYFFYRSRDTILFDEIVVDIQITVAIIAFFVAWIGISAARKSLIAGEPERVMAGTGRLPIPLPTNAVLRALVITVALMFVYGGLVLIGPLSLMGVSGINQWGYVAFKTLYTGGCAACAAALAIMSVFQEYSE